MNNLQIPDILNTKKINSYINRTFVLMLVLSLFFHICIFLGISFFDNFPLFLFLQDKPLQNNEKPLNYVLVDEKLLDEEIKDEIPKVLGRVSRQSRDSVVNPELPKNGPSSDTESAMNSFKQGTPLPESLASPELSPSPPPIPQVKPQPVTSPTPVPAKPESLIKKATQEKTIPDLPELEIEDDIKSFMPKIAKATNPKETEKPAETEVPGISSSDEISKINENEMKEPEIELKPEAQQKQEQMAKKPVKPEKNIPTRKIPVRKIGSTSSTTGGKMKKQLNSSAINAGFQSIAVLRNRYGEYMDKILRRIQQAIIIQQQINPISMNNGSVVMSFTINPEGYLDSISFIGSKPQDITTEISAARSVLQDVQNSGAFEPPTQEMLNDPNFQKIVINFIFESL